MKFTTVTETEADREAVDADIAYVPMFLQGQFSAMLARTLQCSVGLGVFDALAEGPFTLEEAAARAGIALRSARQLLEALATTDYARLGADGKYSLTDLGRRWFTGFRRGGAADLAYGGTLDMTWETEFVRFLKTDEPVPVLRTITPEHWDTHQRAQRVFSKAVEAAVLAAVPVPDGARKMLDIGAAHGARAAAFCRRHPALEAYVLDLPGAISAGAPLLAEEGMGGRIVQRAEDPFAAELGAGEYDLIVISSGLLRPTADQRRALTQRAARALRPGGLLAFHDFLPPARVSEAGQQAAVFAMFLLLTGEQSRFGLEEAIALQKEAGLDPLPAVDVAGAMSTLQMARKPGADR
jgi:SAM-dependent methyltransferase